jgi:hypothetical protein
MMMMTIIIIIIINFAENKVLECGLDLSGLG